jgi:chorismate mutase/prephenate dehydratase
VTYIPCETIGDVFENVRNSQADYGVVPIENSTEGAVTYTLDEFVQTPLRICAEIYLPISHHLMASGPRRGIRQVVSHPQVLAQCRNWLQRHLPHAQLIDAPSTSRAVQIAREEAGAAAVASELAAQHYGVPVLVRNIQDKADNTTRFFVLGRQASGPVGSGKDITSFLVSLGDEAASHSGALLKMLMPLAERGINLSKVESRPSKKRPWDYYFFIDVTGHYEDANMKAALTELRQFCPMVKWMGSYPAIS